MMNEVSALSLNLMDRTSSTIYVSNIRHTTPVSSISTIFSKYGPLERCEIPENKFGKTRGFAFIEFENKAHAFTAFDELSKQEILLDGRILKLEWARATKLYKEDIQSLSTESKEKIMGNFSRNHSFDSKYAKNKRKGTNNPKRTGMYNGNSPNVYDNSQMGSKPKPPFNPTVAQPLIKKDLEYSNGNVPSYSHVNPSLSINTGNNNPNNLNTNGLNNSIPKKNLIVSGGGQNYDNKLVGTMMVPNTQFNSNNYIGSGNLNSPSNIINGAVGMKSFNDAPLNNHVNGNAISNNPNNISPNNNNPNTSPSHLNSNNQNNNNNNPSNNTNNNNPNNSNNHNHNTVNENETPNNNNLFSSYFASNINNNFNFNLQSTISSLANLELRANDQVNMVKPNPYSLPINVHSSTHYPNSYLNEDFNPDTQSYNNFTSNILSNPSSYHYFNNQDPVYVNNPTNTSFSHFSNNFSSNFGGFNSYFNSNFN